MATIGNEFDEVAKDAQATNGDKFDEVTQEAQATNEDSDPVDPEDSCQ
jgi:hypothetical protein